MTNKKTPPKELSHVHKYGNECGVTHDNCINSIKGTCDVEPPGHSGSHHCSSCNMSF